MSDSSLSDTHSGGTARTLSQDNSLQYTALYDYEGMGDDELSLHRGDVVLVLSKDWKISGDPGWWTGKLGEKVGIFPSNFVELTETIDRVSSVIEQVQPQEINFDELTLKDVIGIGGFGKVYRLKNKTLTIIYFY